jgi:DNA topoisomerase-3
VLVARGPGLRLRDLKNKAGKTLPPQVVKELIESLRESRERGEDPGVGRTKAQVTGFRGRSGRTFRAKLKLEQNEEGKWRVEFDEEWAQEPRPTPPDDDGGAQAAAPADAAAPAEGAAQGTEPEKVTAGAVASDRGS